MLKYASAAAGTSPIVSVRVTQTVEGGSPNCVLLMAIWEEFLKNIMLTWLSPHIHFGQIRGPIVYELLIQKVCSSSAQQYTMIECSGFFQMYVG